MLLVVPHFFWWSNTHEGQFYLPLFKGTHSKPTLLLITSWKLTHCHRPKHEPPCKSCRNSWLVFTHDSWKLNWHSIPNQKWKMQSKWCKFWNGTFPNSAINSSIKEPVPGYRLCWRSQDPLSLGEHWRAGLGWPGNHSPEENKCKKQPKTTWI